MKIYTKTGDTGMTSTLYGERISKSSMMIELQGGIDEINAGVGYLRSINNRTCRLEEVDQMLKWIQKVLINMGVDVSNKFSTQCIDEEMMIRIEKSIDDYNSSVDELKSFIYYSGNEAATYAHVLRALTRQVERTFVRFHEEERIEITTLDYQFINRLSDFLFILSRYFNNKNGDSEEIMND